MTTKRTLADERAAFEAMLPELLQSHDGEFVVVHEGVAVSFHPTFADAYAAAIRTYGRDAVVLVTEVAEPNPVPVSLSWSLGVM